MRCPFQFRSLSSRYHLQLIVRIGSIIVMQGNRLYLLMENEGMIYNRDRDLEKFSAGGSHRTRTCNPLIKSQMLYQLS
jgi:hypothetical protein